MSERFKPATAEEVETLYNALVNARERANANYSLMYDSREGIVAGLEMAMDIIEIKFSDQPTYKYEKL